MDVTDFSHEAASALSVHSDQRLHHTTLRPSPTQFVFRRRSHRVSKPSSTGNSPRKKAGRRSTLAAGMSQPKIVMDHGSFADSRAVDVGTGGDLTITSRTRPTSWHPSSCLGTATTAFPTTTPYYRDGEVSDYPFPSMSFSTAMVNGLVTPLSQPCYNEPPIQESLTALDNSQPYPDPYAFLDEFRADPDPNWAMYSPLSTPFDGPYYGHNSYGAQQLQTHTFPQPSENTAPPSPDFLPIQGTANDTNDDEPSPLLSKIASATEELVGMGLYDPPSQSFGLPYRGKLGSIGKGLKLEETFEPSTDDEDGENDGEGDDEVDEGHTARQQKSSAPASSDLASRSFFF